METFIGLHCFTRTTIKNAAYNVTWYWSQCVNDAGTKGTAILLENNRDEYIYFYYMSSYGSKGTSIFFESLNLLRDTTGVRSAVTLQTSPLDHH